ncbi:MAG: ABC transporter substrate-binding protein [Ottowia sp.]|uniref:ABC transporter substrate-binding protein n=1 Tax=unclassified Ottowia TaxID=2645081 RepID=UPI003C30E4D6
MNPINRRRFTQTTLGGLVGLSVALPRMAQAQSGLTELVVAEPLHSTGYLPLYVAVDQGFFTEEKIKLKILTVEGGAGHTNAVLTKQAFAFLGGPEHNAFAKAKGAELRAIVNVVNRGNVYLVARKGMGPKDKNLAAFMKGKRIATQPYGGTPNSITRYLLKEWGLAPTDVQLQEISGAAALSAVKTGNADVAVTTEPLLTRGVREGIWDEPFFNVPKELGDYAYSTINVRKESIDTDPQVVAAFSRAMVKGLKATYADPAMAANVAKKEFPTMSLDDMKATIDRSFADSMWSKDGKIAPGAWSTCSRVVRTANLLKTDVAYADVIDQRFVS